MTGDPPMADIHGLEERGWQALSSHDPIPFCQDWLADDALLVVPGMILTKDAFLASLTHEPPWAAHDTEDARTVQFSLDCAALVYKVRARRADQPPYVALILSVYRFGGDGWKLIYHQQTPSPQ